MKNLRKIGSTDMEVAAVGYGCMGQTHSYGQLHAEDAMVELMRYAQEVGYAMFDTAPAYGDQNEVYLGKAVKPFRDKVVIATKFGIDPKEFFTVPGGGLHSDHGSILEQVDASLKRLDVDYIDLYYQHRVDPKVSPEEVAETMKELAKAGKIRAWGVSFAPVDYIRRAHAVFPISAIENSYHFLARDDEKEYFPLCEELGITYVSSTPLAKGFLSAAYSKDSKYKAADWRNNISIFREEGMEKNRDLLQLIREMAEEKGATAAQISLAWEINQKPFIIPIPGTTKKERLKENFDSVNVELSRAEMEQINDAVAKMDLEGMRMLFDKPFLPDPTEVEKP